MSSTKPLHAPSTPAHGDVPFHPSSWLARAGAMLKEAGTRWADDSCYRMGASLAFYALFSLFPLLLVAVSVFGFVLGGDAAGREKVIGSVGNLLSPEARPILEDTLASMQSHETARGIGAAVGLLTLVFGASGVFSELETSLDAIWRVKPLTDASVGTTILRAVKDKAISFAAVACAGAILLASLLVGTALHAVSDVAGRILPDALLWQAIEAIVSFLLAGAVFAVLFRMLPRAAVAWRDVLAGALVTAFLFSVSKHLLGWYLGHLGSYAAYGAVGGVLGLLMWIYLVSFVVFFGAELTRVYAEREGSLAGHSG